MGTTDSMSTLTEKETEAEALRDWSVPFDRLPAELSWALLSFYGLAGANLVHVPDMNMVASTGRERLCCPACFLPRWFWKEGGDAAKGDDDSTQGLANVLFLFLWLLYI